MTEVDFIALLKKQTDLKSDEANIAGPTLISRWVNDALRAHNATYTFATLPDQEIMCVMYLSWIKICEWRAGRVANDVNEKAGSGFQQENSTPFTKNMELRKRLWEAYKQLVADLKLIPAGEQIVQGDITVTDPFLGGTGPANAALAPDPAVLTVSEITSVSVVLRWSLPYFSNFRAFAIISDEAPGILQDWNLDGVHGIPRLRTDVEFLKEYYDYHSQAAKVTGLLPDTDYYFIVVTSSGSGTYSYSNEVTAHTIP